ncbi:MAG: hypothetical protein Q8P68_00510 [Candidatus Peregrinibacteria bacterium]|nr:hypothetical protein [Candidatus Peregrinibacteria bacterium]MDZ4245183.1 hypothetical protein [Candidatus Gracilibacteria bacterium]
MGRKDPGPTRQMPTVDEVEDDATGRVLTDADSFFNGEPVFEEAKEVDPEISVPVVDNSVGVETLIPERAAETGGAVVAFEPLEEDGSFGVSDRTVPIMEALRTDTAKALTEMTDGWDDDLEKKLEEAKIKILLDNCKSMFRRFSPKAMARLANLILENPEAGFVWIKSLDVLIRCDADKISKNPIKGPGMYILNLEDSDTDITLLASSPKDTGDGLLASSFKKAHAGVVGEATSHGLPASATVSYMGRSPLNALFIPASLIQALPADAQAELLTRGLEARNYLSGLNLDMTMDTAEDTAPYTIPMNSLPKETLNWLIDSGLAEAVNAADISTYDEDIESGKDVTARSYYAGDDIELLQGYVAYIKSGVLSVAENQTAGFGENKVLARISEGNLTGEMVAATGNAPSAKLTAETVVEIVYIRIPKTTKGMPNRKEVLEERIAALRALHFNLASTLQRAASHRNALAAQASKRARRRR